MAFTRIAGLNDPVSALDDRVSGQADTLKAYFDKSPQQLLAAINALIGELEATTAGASIGVSASGIAATKLSSALAELRLAIDDLVGGLIPEQSVTTARIADGAVTAEKLAEAYKTGVANDIAAVSVSSASLLNTHKTDGLAHSALFNAKIGKVASPTADNIAKLTSGGEVADSGKKVSDLAAKPLKVTTYSGGAVTLADNTEYTFTGVTGLAIAFPAGSFLSHMRITAASIGTVNVTFPISAKYIGRKPDIKKGETWEISIRSGVVVGGKEGDGT